MKLLELESQTKRSQHPNEEIRRRAAIGLATFLTDPDVLIRRKAIQALAAMGFDAEPVWEDIKHAAKDKDAEVRNFANQSLQEFDKITSRRKAEEIRKAILAAAKELNDTQPEKRVKALNKLAASGPAANIVCEQIIEAMRDKVGAVATAATEALAQVNPTLHPHVTAILRGPNKRAAITALGDLGPEAAPALPLLLYCNENMVFWGGGKEIQRPPTVITPTGVTPPVEPLRTYEDLFPIIAKIAPSDKRFATAVLTAISTPNLKTDRTLRERRLAGIEQLKVIDASTVDKVTALVVAMQDGENLIPVINALEEFGDEAKAALPLLRKLKQSPNSTISNAAIRALAKIE